MMNFRKLRQDVVDRRYVKATHFIVFFDCQTNPQREQGTHQSKERAGINSRFWGV